jgi:ATP adenylyltransferase
MRQLWAPWRMGYIKGEKPPGCILCDKPKEKRDASNLILERGKHGFAMLNLYPYNNGHLMVAPYQHVSSLEDLSDEALKGLMQITKKSLLALRKTYKPDGINIGLNLGRAAGAGIEDHLHFHVVPRWGGDTNFMTVVSEVRVIPEDIKRTYQQLKPHFK